MDPGRVTGRADFALTVAQLHHIGHRHLRMWLAARDTKRAPGRWPGSRSSSAIRSCSPMWTQRWEPSPRLGRVGTSAAGSNDAIFPRVAGPDGPSTASASTARRGRDGSRPAARSRRVHGDASMYVGGLRAVLLQTMQPQAMTAVAEHSGYRGDMWGRLARTSRFLAVTTFGTAEHAQQAVDVVRAIHDRVIGTMPDGTPYDANDPHLLEWVHIAEIHSFLLAHQRFGARPLDQAGCDEYVAQTAFVARRARRRRPADHRGGARGRGRAVPARARASSTTRARPCRT